MLDTIHGAVNRLQKICRIVPFNVTDMIINEASVSSSPMFPESGKVESMMNSQSFLFFTPVIFAYPL